MEWGPHVRVRASSVNLGLYRAEASVGALPVQRPRFTHPHENSYLGSTRLCSEPAVPLGKNHFRQSVPGGRQQMYNKSRRNRMPNSVETMASLLDYAGTLFTGIVASQLQFPPLSLSPQASIARQEFEPCLRRCCCDHSLMQPTTQ